VAEMFTSREVLYLNGKLRTIPHHALPARGVERSP
jgi:hypothetical protein